MATDPQECEDVRSLRVEELRLGEPLPGALRDFHGRVLVPGKVRLNEAVLQRVAEATGTRFRVFIGPDWTGYDSTAVRASAAATGQAVFSELLRGKQVQDWVEKRREHRCAWRVPLNLSIEEHSDLTVTRRQVRVQALDISVGGLGFVHTQFLNPGTIVYVHFDMLPGSPILRGQVRYCHLISGMVHRVGICFDNQRPDEPAKL